MTKEEEKTTNNQNLSEKQQQHLQNTDQEPQTVSQETMKKKIIKKFPFTKTVNKTHEHNDNKGTDDDELKNWKPVNLESMKKGNINNNANDTNKLNSNKKGISFANTFLSTLPKPKGLNTTNEEVNLLKLRQELGMQNEKKRGLLLASSLLRVEEKQRQEEWDGEDEFMKKAIPTKDINIDQTEEVLNEEEEKQSITKRENKFSLKEESDDENIVIERIDWLNKKKSGNGNKKELNIADLVNRTWEKEERLITDLRNGFEDDDSSGDINEGNNNKKKTKRI